MNEYDELNQKLFWLYINYNAKVGCSSSIQLYPNSRLQGDPVSQVLISSPKYVKIYTLLV